MSAYPSVNWWPGNLRSHESILSFLCRFCALNGTSLAQGLYHFKLESESSVLSDADIERIASMLNEDVTVVRSVFAPSITLDHCGNYGVESGPYCPDQVRYCENCAAHGYHSYLHEARWLSKCPFHQTELNTFGPTSVYGSLASRRAAAFITLMKSKSVNWPSIEGLHADESAQNRLYLLEEWVARVSLVAREQSKGEIWLARISEFSWITGVQIFGCLHAFSPIPIELQSLISVPIEKWTKNVRRFPLKAKTELERLKSYFKFADLFDFYKRVRSISLSPPRFVKKCDAAMTAIRKRHKEDHCRWNRVEIGWYNYRWIREEVEDCSRWSRICPYALALEELEVGWRCWLQHSTNRESYTMMRLFIIFASSVYNAGLITFTPGAEVSPKGYLTLTQPIWPCCEWVLDSPLTNVLNAAAELEVESISQALFRWLDRIERGGHPGKRADPYGCLRLVETDKGLSLIHWVPPKVIHSSSMPNTQNLD